jgi:glutaredoxin
MDIIARKILSTFDQVQRDSIDLHTFFEYVGGNVPAQREAVLDAVTALAERGFIEGDGRSDFYRRTEEGRLAVASPLDVTMYMREGCHLCEEAKANIAPVLAACGAKLHEVDIDDDPKLLERYTNDVPVIFIGSQFFAQHRVDVGRLRRQLKSAKN